MKKLLALLLLIPSLALAAQVSENTKFESLDDFSGGLNTQVAPHKISKNMSPNLENVLVDEKPGSVVTANGFTVVGATSALTKINFMKEYVKDDGQKYLFVSDSSRVLCTQDFVTFTVIKSTLTTSARLSAAQGRGKMLFTNGSDPVFASDCSGQAEVLDGKNGSVNIPIGKFITYYHDRFWIFNTTENASALRFMALTSTDGIAVSYNDTRAWPITNQLNINQGDGAVGSALDVFKGQLYAHKNNKAIFTIFGNDELTYFARKTNAHTGTVSQDSLVQSDNLTYYFAKDGIYAFDGGDSVRISDLIMPDIQAVANNLTAIVPHIWDTQSQFEKGVFHNTTTTANGILKVFENPKANRLNIVGETEADVDAKYYEFGNRNGSTTTATSVYFKLPYSNVETNFAYGAIDVSTVETRQISRQAPFIDVPVTITFRNTRTGNSVSVSSSIAYKEGSNPVKFDLQPDLDVSSADFVSGNVEFKIDVNTGTVANPTFTGVSARIHISSLPLANHAEIMLRSTTGQFYSEITTATTVTYWDTFQTVDSPNAGTIQYFYRANNTVANISTSAYTAITPGAVINASSNFTRIQWASTMTIVSGSTPTADKITINHNEGGGSDTVPIGIERKGRYWLAITTDASGTNSIIYVKSRITNSNPNAYTKITGINIKSWSKFGDDFYAGSSTAGVILRMDHGDSYNGSPITWIYDTPDLDMGDKYNEKNQIEYLVDVKKVSGANMTLGISVDGSSFVNKSFSIDGSGRLIRTLKLNPTNDGIKKAGKYFRYRFTNNELSKPSQVHGFGIYYTPTGVRD